MHSEHVCSRMSSSHKQGAGPCVWTEFGSSSVDERDADEHEREPSQGGHQCVEPETPFTVCDDEGHASQCQQQAQSEAPEQCQMLQGHVVSSRRGASGGCKSL